MLTDRQLAMLHAPIDKQRIQFLKGNSHLEQWDVRRHLIRVFGFTGWGVETMELACVASNSVQDSGRWKHTVVYRAQVRLTVKDTSGNIIGQWEDGAGGDAINQPHLGDAHDLAMKTALSQALKRCAVNLGDQFGLSLYNDGDARPVVNWSVAYPKPETEPEPDPPVKQEPRTVSQAIDDADSYDDGSRPDANPETVQVVREEAEVNGREPARDNTAPHTRVLAETFGEMYELARQLNFDQQLPGQFKQSFGVDIMQGSVEQYRQAIDLMKASHA